MTSTTTRRWAAAAAAAVLALLFPGREARAFCGFYVSGAGARLTNNATQVVLMREGLRTVLSMQNNYQGPPQDFAMVVPVPVVLHKENVKTLARDVFDRVDQLTAPRLVEYWEQDPCPQPMLMEAEMARGAPAAAAPPAPVPMMARKAVRIEAQFTVGEYDIVVLSATDSSALDTWLRQNGYKIPAGAEPYLRPYVQMGMKFFVAKVDVTKVKFERVGNGPEQAMLSPLRFHYDSDAFALPIRLGLINSGGTQDLVVTIVAPNQRYEAANYDNVAIPTNIDVADATRDQFAAFYAKLFDQTVEKHPRSVVTEYSWSAYSCDPCPTPPLGDAELQTLGADVLPSSAPQPGPSGAAGGAPIVPMPMRRPMPVRGPSAAFVVTRLHARYSRDALGDDLVFRAAPPIVGGREFLQTDGKLEQGARPDSTNNFQARYAIRHPWTGPIACSNPRRGVWGGKPGSDPWASGSPPVRPAAKIAFAPRTGTLTLAAFVRGGLPPETFLSGGGAAPPLLVHGASPDDASAPPADDSGAPPALTDAEAPAAVDAGATALPRTAPQTGGGCAGCAMSPAAPASGAGLALLVLAAIVATRIVAARGRKQG
jgi:MYXO-CTERM domain-containing protein